MSLNDLPFRGRFNFLGLPEETNSFEQARAVIFPVPYDSTTSYRAGTREGPAAIIAASRNVELFDIELGCEPLNTGLFTLPELEPDMRGPEGTIERVQTVTAEMLKAGKLPVMLGGEHSLTTGSLRAMLAHYGPDISVLQLDAHADLRAEYENTPFSHASVMRRLIEMNLPLTQVGIRNISRGEMDFVRESGHMGIFWAHELQGPVETWMAPILARLKGKLYITIDLDAFDPAIMPAVGTPEPGGLNWYPVLKLLKAAIDKCDVIGLDVVELCPIPGSIASDFFAAKLVFKLLGMIFAKNKWTE
ncbi:MAG: agmatinase [Candidatus Ozemobacteraceae bacterium]